MFRKSTLNFMRRFAEDFFENHDLYGMKFAPKLCRDFGYTCEEKRDGLFITLTYY